MWPLLICAQSEPLSGGAGWMGAGLLGIVLGWLLFVHLPSKDKQFMEMMKQKDESIERVMVKFEAALDKVINHCEEEIEAIRTYYQRAYAAPSHLPTPPHGIKRDGA